MQIINVFKTKIDELQNLVKYEQEKQELQTKLDKYLDELKQAKLEKRQYQEQANQIPEFK